MEITAWTSSHGPSGIIKRIAAEKPLWGTPRIQAELAMLGHKVARATISNYLGIRPTGSPTWRAFIRNHLDCTAAMDCFTVPTITGRVLYVFVILHHARRRIVHFNVTAHPTAEWVVHQLREAFPFDSAPRFLIHDNDSIFGEAVALSMRSMGITDFLTSLGSPGRTLTPSASWDDAARMPRSRHRREGSPLDSGDTSTCNLLPRGAMSSFAWS